MKVAIYSQKEQFVLKMEQDIASVKLILGVHSNK